MTATATTAPDPPVPQIGRDAGPFGRVFRLVTGR